MALASKRKHKSNHVVRPLVKGSILILRISEVKVDPAVPTTLFAMEQFEQTIGLILGLLKGKAFKLPNHRI